MIILKHLGHRRGIRNRIAPSSKSATGPRRLMIVLRQEIVFLDTHVERCGNTCGPSTYGRMMMLRLEILIGVLCFRLLLHFLILRPLGFCFAL